MIQLYALGSGSGGNAFLIDGPEGILLLDAGFSTRELTRRAGLLKLDLDRLIGIALTHEHGDHASGARRLARRHGVPIVATDGTLRALDLADDEPRATLRSASIVEVGPFQLESCRTLHDAAEPTAVVIETSGARIGLAYDLGRPTMGLRHLLRHCDALVIEANYDDVMLRTSNYPASVQHRIAGSGGHLSNRAAAELLTDLWHDGLSVVMLAHLSRQCNAPEVAHRTVLDLLAPLGFRGTLAVAAQDVPVGPIPVAPSYARVRTAPQVELELT